MLLKYESKPKNHKKNGHDDDDDVNGKSYL